MDTTDTGRRMLHDAEARRGSSVRDMQRRLGEVHDFAESAHAIATRGAASCRALARSARRETRRASGEISAGPLRAGSGCPMESGEIQCFARFSSTGWHTHTHISTPPHRLTSSQPDNHIVMAWLESGQRRGGIKLWAAAASVPDGGRHATPANAARERERVPGSRRSIARY